MCGGVSQASRCLSETAKEVAGLAALTPLCSRRASTSTAAYQDFVAHVLCDVQATGTEKVQESRAHARLLGKGAEAAAEAAKACGEQLLAYAHVLDIAAAGAAEELDCLPAIASLLRLCVPPRSGTHSPLADAPTPVAGISYHSSVADLMDAGAYVRDGAEITCQCSGPGSVGFVPGPTPEARDHNFTSLCVYDAQGAAVEWDGSLEGCVSVCVDAAGAVVSPCLLSLAADAVYFWYTVPAGWRTPLRLCVTAWGKRSCVMAQVCADQCVCLSCLSSA